MRKKKPVIPVLDLQNIFLTRAGRPVLKKIDWVIHPGQNWVLCGHNGSGKTSLLEVVTGYLWATKGKVVVMGEEYGKTFLPEFRKKIGFCAPWVIQHLKPWETVTEAVASGLEASVEYQRKLKPSSLASIHRLLRFFGCLEYAQTQFGSLSSGEQMKVILARAMLAQPPLLILDEPFASLDMGARWELTGKLKQLASARHAPAMILVTHHLEEIPSFFSHAMILKKGRIFACGRRHAVLKKSILQKAFRF